MLMFGDHAVAVGFVLSFSPYVYEVIVSMIFVVLRIIYEVRLHKFDHHVKFIKTRSSF
jgi:membrane protein implicated in regulation of membrane protease activity